MQRLLSIAFRDLLDKDIWIAISELSIFFRDLIDINLNVENLRFLHENISKILCKLQKNLSAKFFESIEHFPIHLAYEAILDAPIQFRWIYPFER
ncbi:hypothetical protein Syun_018975 [Stephania yunnanensis]|uniref:DUF4218 domain-containing protein n=1 Tax=Stephania yunnanensis TaxID=152371 RepID=A0AAP0NWA2_9MAGN